MSPRTSLGTTLNDNELPRVPARPAAPATQRGRRTALSVVLLLSFLVAAWIASPLWVGIVLGAVMAFTTQSMFRALYGRLGERRKLGAALVTMGTGLVCAAAAALVLYIASRELVTLVGFLQEKASDGPPSRFLGTGAVTFLHHFGVEPSSVDDRIRHQMEATGSYAARAAAAVLQATTSAVFGLMVALVTMFYVLVEWPRLAVRLENLLPLDPRHTRALILEFRDIGRGALVGTIGTAIVQGVLAGIGYAIGGASQILTFGLLTAIASLLPVVGTAAVWAPIGGYQLATGHAFGGTFILAWGLCVVMTMSDYVIRPRLVGRSGHGHPLLILIALLGGFEVLGLAGLIVAPILMSLFVAVLRIYERELTP